MNEEIEKKIDDILHEVRTVTFLTALNLFIISMIVFGALILVINI